MRKFFALTIILMLLLSLSSVAIAKKQNENILLNRIVIIDNNPLTTSVSIENINEESKGHVFDFDDGKIVLLIPELGLRAARNVNVDEGDKTSRRVSIDIPEGTPSGEYWMRITVTNEDVKRVKHRVITI